MNHMPGKDLFTLPFHHFFSQTGYGFPMPGKIERYLLIASAMTVVSIVLLALVQSSPDWLGVNLIPHWLGTRELIGIAVISVIVGPWVIGD